MFHKFCQTIPRMEGVALVLTLNEKKAHPCFQWVPRQSPQTAKFIFLSGSTIKFKHFLPSWHFGQFLLLLHFLLRTELEFQTLASWLRGQNQRPKPVGVTPILSRQSIWEDDVAFGDIWLPPNDYWLCSGEKWGRWKRFPWSRSVKKRIVLWPSIMENANSAWRWPG